MSLRPAALLLSLIALVSAGCSRPAPEVQPSTALSSPSPAETGPSPAASDDLRIAEIRATALGPLFKAIQSGDADRAGSFALDEQEKVPLAELASGFQAMASRTWSTEPGWS
ncbi:MAG: hypothetical protein ACT4OM_07030 [Actinomycetota bacterium]